MMEKTPMPPATTAARQTPNRQRRIPAPKGMRSRTPLGIFQYLVMCAIAALDKRAYVIEIQDYFTNDIQLAVDAAQIYVTAKQLAKLGLLDTEMIPHPEDAGRPVKMYTITKEGDAAIAATARLLAAVMQPHGGISSHAPRTTATRPVATSKRVRPRTKSDRG